MFGNTLNRIQAKERAKKKYNRVVMLYGMPTPPGTKPKEYTQQVPIFKPIELPTFDAAKYLEALNDFLRIPWWKRGRKK